MTPNTLPPSPRIAPAAVDAALRIWAKAIGCSTNQVTDIVTRAGLPMEKLWNPCGRGERRDRTAS